MTKLHIQCICGRNEKLTDEQSERLPWNEDETLSCHCGRKIRYAGRNTPRVGTAVYVEDE